MMKQLRQFLFACLIFAILFAYAMFQGGKVSWFMFFSFLPIFIYAVCLKLYPISKWQVERKLQKRIIRAGDDILLVIRIKRSIPFPLFSLVCEAVFPNTLKRIDNGLTKYTTFDSGQHLYIERESKKIIFPWFKRVIEIPFQLHQVPRGEHILQEVKVRTSDLFGFIKKEHTFHLKDYIQVYPNERKITMDKQISSFEHGPISSSVLHARQANIVSGTREYIPGDRLSWVDWKQTARKNKIMTKEFEQEKSTDTLIVLDSSSHQNMSEIPYEGSVEIVMSLVGLLQRQGTNIGLLSIGKDAGRVSLKPDPNKYEKVRNLLMRIQPSNNRNFSVQLKEEITKTNGQFAIIIVTTRMDAAFKQVLTELRRKTRKITVLIIMAAKKITPKDYEMIQELQFANVDIQVLTEKEMKQQWLEVTG